MASIGSGVISRFMNPAWNHFIPRNNTPDTNDSEELFLHVFNIIEESLIAEYQKWRPETSVPMSRQEEILATNGYELNCIIDSPYSAVYYTLKKVFANNDLMTTELILYYIYEKYGTMFKKISNLVIDMIPSGDEYKALFNLIVANIDVSFVIENMTNLIYPEMKLFDVPWKNEIMTKKISEFCSYKTIEFAYIVANSSFPERFVAVYNMYADRFANPVAECYNWDNYNIAKTVDMLKNQKVIYDHMKKARLLAHMALGRNVHCDAMYTIAYRLCGIPELDG